MQYKQFEDLPVWKKAIELAVEVHRAGRSGTFDDFGDLRSQVERAALSISNNIAEGFERGTRGELLNFLYIARGSAGEVRSMMHLCRELADSEARLQHLDRLHPLLLSVSRQLGAWLESLKNSDSLSPRERTEAVREAAAESRRRGAFVEQLQRIARGELEFQPPPGNAPKRA